jgi:hypothetical protein
MRLHHLQSLGIRAGLAAAALLLGGGAALAQQQINLSAGPALAALPDGTQVPMWGYTCGSAVTGSTAACAPLNPAAGAGAWSPVVITVPTGQALTINLTNRLSFTPAGGTAANGIPTSLVIVGQLGGGLGDPSQRTVTAPPDHTNAQSVTWPITNSTSPVGLGTPPVQGPRVQSFATEVAAGATSALTWPNLRPGTYLIESGTHPSIQGAMGLYGMLVVTTAPAGGAAGTAYPAAGGSPAVTYNTEVPLLMSEIDPVQNTAVQAAVQTAGFSETMVWNGLPGGCGNPGSPTFHQCYPPAVNYSPLYYLFNGVAFDRTHAALSLFPAVPGTAAAPVSGSVLVRLVNAGLRMHVPSIVGAQAGTAPGMTLVAEDGNVLPGVPRVQSEVFMAAGKTQDLRVNVPAAGASALPIFDRQLSLSANAVGRDGGMLAYIGVNGAGAPAGASAVAVARADSYGVVPGQTLTVSDPAHGLMANDSNVYGVALIGTVAGLNLHADGTFTYSGPPTTFSYCANGTVTGTTCSSGVTATVTLGAAAVEAASGITCSPQTFTSSVASSIAVSPPGILAGCIDGAGYPLSVDTTSIHATGATVIADASGGFTATPATPGSTASFTFLAKNAQGTVAATPTTVTVQFLAASGLQVAVRDAAGTPITDYRWIIEEDRTFYVDPRCTTNPPPAGCPTAGAGIVPTFGTNFHTSYMPVVATGCTGRLSCEGGQTVLGVPAVCDLGNGACRTDAAQQRAVDPAQVHLDPTKRYYLSVLPGDAANPFGATYLGPPDCTPAGVTAGHCGHGMGGAPIAAGQTSVAVLVQQTPLPPAKLTVFVFEDDFPLNGEQDAGGGVDVLSPNEPGLGSFNITLFDDAGGTGDATGQMTYDMFNQPLSNSLAGTIDPSTGMDACPISKVARSGTNDPTQTGITGTIVTCPRFESDGKTLSPLAGQAVVANMMPGRYGVVATPGADRIARGEEWLQTNTLDGQKAHDSFLRIGEPSFFQEFGPAGYHVSIGFANPKIINDRKASVCNGTNTNVTGANCTNTVTGLVSTLRMSRTPDERLYGSGDNSSFGFTQCYVSFGDPDGIDFAFTKCNADGTFTLSGLPDGDWRITVFDQWNDMLVDGLSTPVRLAGGATLNMGEVAINQWQTNIYTSTFLDLNGNGVRDPGEPGLPLVATNNRFRDGSYSNFNNTDLQGNAGFNEIFPLFSWYVIETYNTRYKNTGAHVVYDAGGPADGNPACGANGFPPCGSSTIAGNMANTFEAIPVPAALRVPGAFYCATADCADAPAPLAPGGNGGSTGRVDPPWVQSEGWQGFSGQNEFIEFGKKPYAAGETGGIQGEVIYASTRPFDDPALLIHTSWTPDIPGVTVNLYQESTAPDGTTALTLVDTTKTSSFDDWAQGFHLAADGVTRIPNMSCPGQGTASGTNADLFFFSLFDQPQWLDLYGSQHGGPAPTALPDHSQFKCYDGMHNWNQIQPAPYDGMYQFPSVTAMDPVTGKPTGTHCTACVPNPDSTDPYRFGTPMLPPGKYVVEVVVPPGYELVKEEDKNILIGDNFIAPVTVQFPGLGSAIYILPDQAEVGASVNANNWQNGTQSLGRTTLPSHEGDTGSVETFWPCVGASRVVPDYISLFPGSHEVAPFAGATRRLCDRKEVTLTEQASALAKFWLFTSTHVAAHFTGIITDDFTSEFDPFSPQFGEKFSPPDLPVAIKDWTGAEISRVYADHWGAYDGLTYSTWEVNPPNPTGYSPTMMVTCMNDPGNGPTPDPLYNPAYSQFCYEIPFMPGQTQYMDTPVIPTSAFAGAGYNNADCAYPDAVPGVKEVDGDGVGPWVSAAGHTLTITAIGDQPVNNYGYSGPSANTAPFNQKTVTRHYGFGTRCTAVGGTCAAVSSVTIGGVPATVTGWTDAQITVTVPGGTAATNLPLCSIQQQAQYSGSTARCGELVITAGNGKQSVDTVTVTIGGKAPTHVPATGSIQAAIDAAAPGDMLMIDPNGSGAAATPAVHNELLLMWKPLRLQGVGAVSSVINANTHPAGKLDDWRRRVNCLMGLAINGSPITTANPFDPTGTFACGTSNGVAWQFFRPFDGRNPQVDRLPFEATVGWDANLNGNLAELLQEPSLMGALEGAGITVLAKGVNFPSNPFDPALFAGFPTGTALLTPTSRGCAQGTRITNPFPSSFWCNPSSIDGLTVTNSSQGGGGIFVHGWGHNIQIANNRVQNNSGTLSGGINVGQGEFPPGYTQGGAANAPPGSCYRTSAFPGAPVPTNTQLPYCHDLNVNVHHNAVMLNSSTGDELFSATPAGAGGVSFTTGSDNYTLQNNWICGNLSVGDGGGVAQLGFVWNGDMEHNTVIFNQSTNPTIPTNGGGVLVYGAPDVDPPCAVNDQDCLSAANTISPSDGTGPGLKINANLIMGNAAESGSGGGLRLHNVNGTDVLTFPTRPDRWYAPVVTNNIIVDNVAGWDGAGISLIDALSVNIINNTIMSNDTTASAGVLFNTLGAPLASSQGPCPVPRDSTGVCPVPWTTSIAQPAGLVSIQNSAVLSANLPATVTCPDGHFLPGTPATNGTCRSYSYPLLLNNVFWQNRAFYIGVGGLGAGTLNQQNVVTLFDGFSTSRPVSQTATGQCPTDPNVYYWDIGVRGDTSRTNHAGGRLSPAYSILTDAADYPGLFNSGANPGVAGQYCNGARVPPENGGLGYQVPPGIADATVPNPVFSLTPAATVDEGNNWININWGPLSTTNPVTHATLGNYTPAGPTSATVNFIPASSPTYAFAPATDFFGNSRKNGFVDAGAVEFTGGAAVVAVLTGGPLSFGSVAVGATSAPQDLTLTNPGGAALAGIGGAITGPFAAVTTGTFPAGAPLCGTTLAAGASCTIRVVFAPTAVGPATGSVTVTAGGPVGGSPAALTGTGVASAPAATLTPATWNPTGVRGCGLLSCPGALFTLTNTGSVPLAGITQGTITGASEFTVFRALSTCGPAGGGQLLGQTTLAPGATCTIAVRFAPPVGDTTGARSASLSVGDAAGVQTSALGGTVAAAAAALARQVTGQQQ